MYEPLINKKKKIEGWDEGGGWIIEDDDNFDSNHSLFSAEDVLSAVKFYKRYCFFSKLLEEEAPGIWKEWKKTSDFLSWKSLNDVGDYESANELYNIWLFNYTFKDITYVEGDRE